ncbi:MAG: hypothetical protein ABIY70_08765 [Capsulimonas sp.]|uniref:hypothetical protein n=1 Tax=Capsulimonas sp. TaxID=2494211 RepID=UPI0032645182
MTDEQKQAVRVLSECRAWNPWHRTRIDNWATTLIADPDAWIPSYEVRALLRMLHTYRRQHHLCRCEICFGTLIGKLQEPTQFSLFETNER